MDTRNPPAPEKKKRMNLSTAAAYLGVSAAMMSRLVKAGVLPYSVDPLDRRLKLVRVADLDRLKERSQIAHEED